MISIKTRQQYLKNLGFYKGKIDGKEGPLTKKAYKRLKELGKYVKFFYSNKKNHPHDWNVLWPEKDEETIIINSTAFGFLTGQYEEEIAF